MIRAALLWMLCAAPVAAQEIVVIGDSVLAWNGDASAPAVLARDLGQPVDNRAVSGARVAAGFFAGLAGYDIRRQLGAARPRVLVVNGGANDLAADCGCGDCAAAVDALIDDGGRGALGDLVIGAAQDGVAVIYLGYYEDPPGGGPFSGCGAWFDLIDARMQALAPRRPGLTFVSGKAALPGDDLALYDADRVHPSPEGSARLGALLAGVIRQLP